jgi:hypothetical protein
MCYRSMAAIRTSALIKFITIFIETQYPTPTSHIVNRLYIAHLPNAPVTAHARKHGRVEDNNAIAKKYKDGTLTIKGNHE